MILYFIVEYVHALLRYNPPKINNNNHPTPSASGGQTSVRTDGRMDGQKNAKRLQ